MAYLRGYSFIRNPNFLWVQCGFGRDHPKMITISGYSYLPKKWEIGKTRDYAVNRKLKRVINEDSTMYIKFV
jgi:hypothetical protein